MAFAASKTTAGNPGSHHRTHLDLSGWDMRFAHDFTAMFSGCTSITTLNLSNWDLEVACDFSSMFARMDELTSLNFSGWSRYKYRPKTGMFLVQLLIGASIKCSRVAIN